MEQGFVKVDSNNLPRVDYFIINEYYIENMDYISAEYWNVILKQLFQLQVYI